MKTLTIAASSATQNLQAAGFFDWANNMISNIQALIGGVLVLVGLIVFIIVAWRGKNIPSVIGGIVVGGLIAAAGTIIIAMSGVFSQTVQEGNTGGTASVQQQAPNHYSEQSLV